MSHTTSSHVRNANKGSFEKRVNRAISHAAHSFHTGAQCSCRMKLSAHIKLRRPCLEKLCWSLTTTSAYAMFIPRCALLPGDPYACHVINMYLCVVFCMHESVKQVLSQPWRVVGAIIRTYMRSSVSLAFLVPRRLRLH